MRSRIEELGAPASEFNESFVEGMRKRMATSYHKYGLMREAAEAGVQQLESALVRIQRYKDTGNTEWLMDAANMLMIEFTHPLHAEAHFRATDSDESPGRVIPSKLKGQVVGTQLDPRHNHDVR